MSLTPEVIASLTELLNALASADNNVRSLAEKQLNTHWMQQPHVLLAGLAKLVTSGQTEMIRSLAAVLLRRISNKTPPQVNGQPVDPNSDITYWMTVGEETRSYCQAELLASLSAEENAQVRRKVCDTVSELARLMLSHSATWPELLHKVFALSTSPNASHRESAFSIIGTIPAIVADQSHAQIKGAFLNAMGDGDLDVKMSALKACILWILEEDDNLQVNVSDMIPVILNLLPPLIEDHEDKMETALEILIELAEPKPKLFRQVLPQLIEFAAHLMKNEELEESTRQIALEMLLTLAEVSPATCRKQPNFVATVVPVMLKWMTQIEDDEVWYNTDNIEDAEENDDLATIAEQGMDRVARALGGKVTLPAAFQYIPTMLGSSNWQERYAALMAISAIGEGCVKIMMPELDKVLDMVIPHLRDPHPRVRYAACNCVGQMSTDFTPKLQKLHHSKVVPALCAVMEDGTVTRVQSHAAAALVNFADEASKRDLSPYLDIIFERLLSLLASPKIYVQEQALTTIATVADAAEEMFGKYYGHIMPGLMNVLRNAQGKEYRLLRGKAMECATLIALAVGKEVFRPDAEELIKILTQLQAGITEADDPQSSYLLAAWARICKVLGTEFAPWLDTVMPPLLAAAQLRPDFVMLDQDEEPGEEYAEEEGWQFVPVEGQKFGIKTTVLEDKCTAVEMLICYARELGATFSRYAEQVLNIVVPLLKFWFHDGVRHAAATCIPFVFDSFTLAGMPQDQVLLIWHNVAAKILDASPMEPETYIVAQLYSTFCDSLSKIGRNCLTSALMEQFTTSCIDQLQDLAQRMKERQESRADADHDAEHEEVLQEDETNDDLLLGELSRAVHEVFKTHGVGYLPYFDQLLPAVTSLLDSSKADLRQWALCIFDDVIEFTGPESLKYAPHFLEKLVNSLRDSSWDVRQTAAYGIGVAAQFGGDGYTETIRAALPLLLENIKTPGSKDEERIVSTENAISALGKLAHYMPTKVDVNAVLLEWFNALPIVTDDEEAPHTYTYLMELLESHHPVIMGENNSNLPRLVHIFTEALASEILSKDLAEKMVVYLKGLLANMDATTREQLWMSIPAEKKSILAENGWI